VDRAKKFAGLYIALAVILSGCSFDIQRPTLAPIYVTATPEPNSATETPRPTTVLGATAVVGQATAPVFPTLEPATATPTKPPKPTQTPTFTPTFTESPVPRSTRRAIAAAATAAAAGLPVASGACGAAGPQGGFAAIYTQNPAAAQQLGCAVSQAIPINSASIGFERGSMVWVSQFADVSGKMIYALYQNGTYQRFSDVWTEGVNPETTGEVAPAGLLTPARGFGKIWHENPTVKDSLGWATGAEVGTNGMIQRFERGEMVFVANLGKTFIFANGTWQVSQSGF
jgi:hypothetical protein